MPLCLAAVALAAQLVHEQPVAGLARQERFRASAGAYGVLQIAVEDSGNMPPSDPIWWNTGPPAMSRW